MSDGVLRVAVVGHTNTGKTSLLRTLMRDARFGEVSDRPATTRHVEGAAILADGAEVMHLYDTPGLEDSSGLHERLASLRREQRVDGPAAIDRFLESADATARFAQESKALRQVLAADVALYVVDARDPVLGRHRDELEILAWCARPIVPVLNFIAGEGARIAEWRSHLARAALHAVAEFDTVIFNEQHEERLYEKLRTLVDRHREAIDALIGHRRRGRGRLVLASAQIIAELLLDAAAFTRWAVAAQPDQVAAAVESFKDELRRRERQCIAALVELHRFDVLDATGVEPAAIVGDAQPDLFSPTALRQFGLSAGRGAAIGALAGLAIDVVVGGLSLGAAAAAGAGVGALVESARTQGRLLVRRAQGQTPIRCDDATLRLLALRQIALCRALLSRGHASQTPIHRGFAASMKPVAQQAFAAPLPRPLKEARSNPQWSGIAGEAHSGLSASVPRQRAIDELAGLIEHRLIERPEVPLRFP